MNRKMVERGMTTASSYKEWSSGSTTASGWVPQVETISTPFTTLISATFSILIIKHHKTRDANFKTPDHDRKLIYVLLDHKFN